MPIITLCLSEWRWEVEGWRSQRPGAPGSLWTLSTFKRQPFKPSICGAFRGIDSPIPPTGSWLEAQQSSRSSKASRGGTHFRAMTRWTAELSKQETDSRCLIQAGWLRVWGNQPVCDRLFWQALGRWGGIALCHTCFGPANGPDSCPLLHLGVNS